MTVKRIAELETTMLRRISSLPKRFRPFVRHRDILPRTFMLTGPRGVGKTTYLLHHAKRLSDTQQQRILYLSADNPTLGTESLYEIVASIFLAGYSGVIVDEVHFAKDWSIHMKALYDDFPNHTLWISDSSSLCLRMGKGDLSRRFVHIEMPLLSFREFLYLETGVEYPVYNPFSPNKALPVQPSPDILSAFRMYKGIGTRPFYSEGDFNNRMLSILDKTLYSDIPFFLPSITDGNLRLMKAVSGTLAGTSIPRLQVRSLCSDWGIGADKLYQILQVMESVDLLRIIRKEHTNKVKSAGEKLFFSDPAFYTVLGGDVGNAREALVTMLCSYGGYLVEATKDETTGDFVISKMGAKGSSQVKIEVGGRSKRPKKADFVIHDETDYPGGNTIPLWLLGMMY
ncbi:MAG: AAA family ATPase [Sphaerochaeta sp.]